MLASARLTSLSVTVGATSVIVMVTVVVAVSVAAPEFTSVSVASTPIEYEASSS